MRLAMIALAATAMVAGSAASAAEKLSDVDFLKVNRCRGLAARIDGVVDPAALDSLAKAEGRSRASYVMERADEEFQRAKREARSEDRKDRLTAELTGVCQAYLGAPSNVSKQ